jgi:adenylyltransferase/sulfurtransferase
MTAEDWTSPDRYARHRLIDWWDQERVAAANVLVVGAGALGNEVIKNLGLIGVGAMTIIDLDRVEYTNLSRSILFRDSDVGEWKADAAARAVRKVNPDVNVRTIVGDIEFALGVGELKEFSVILGCLDSVNARWALNRAAIAAGVRWINGGINPTAGEVALFSPGQRPCYECAMTDTMWARFNERYSCNKLLRALPARTLPTTSILASMTAALQVQQALFEVHDAPEGQRGLRPGQKLYMSVKPYSLFVVDLPMNDECLAHDVPAIACEIPVLPEEVTTVEVFSYLRKVGVRPEWVELGFDVVSGLECGRCGIEEVCTPVKLASPSLAVCPLCGDQRTASSVSKILEDDPLASVALSRLGYPPRAVLSIVTETGTIGLALTKPRGDADGK